MNERVLCCVYAAIDEANRDRQDLPPLRKAPDTQLHGTRSDLDSLGLINFLVAAEEAVEREFDVTIAISDDRALDREPSPLQSVALLADYIEELIQEQRR